MLKLLLSIFIISISLIADEQICKNINHKTVPDDLYMPESSFSLENAESTINYFDKDIPKMISKAKKPSDVFDLPQFYISYPNGITILRGFFLKQEYLISKYEYEIAKLKHTDVKRKKQKYLDKKNNFCQFMKDIPIYVD